MRIAIYADTHISDHRGYAGSRPRMEDGTPASLAFVDRSLRWVESVCKERKVDVAVHLGDVFDSGRPTNDEREVAVRHFREMLNTVSRVGCLVGNHDISRAHRRHALVGFDEALRVFDRPDVWMVMGKPLIMVPYPRLEGLWSHFRGAGAVNSIYAAAASAFDNVLAAKALTYPEALVFGHVSVGGAIHHRSGYVPDHDILIPGDVLAMFRKSFFGHIHMRQTLEQGKVQFVGCVDRQRFDEEDYEVGMTIVTIKKSGELKEEFIPNPNPVKFLTIKWPDVPDLDVIGKEHIVRIVGEVSLEKDLEQARELASELTAKCLSIRNDVSLVEINQADVEVRVLDDRNHQDLMDFYLERHPDAIPQDIVDEVRAVVDDVISSAGCL